MEPIVIESQMVVIGHVLSNRLRRQRGSCAERRGQLVVVEEEPHQARNGLAGFRDRGQPAVVIGLEPDFSFVALRALAGHHQSSSVAFASAHWTVRGPVHAKLSGIPMLVEERLAETVGGSFRQGSRELASRLDAQRGENLAQVVFDCARGNGRSRRGGLLKFESEALLAAAAARGAAFRGVGDAFVGGVPGAFGGAVSPPGSAARGAAGVVAIQQLPDELG